MIKRPLLIALLFVLPLTCVAQEPADGSLLPFPPTPMVSVTKPRLQDSSMKWPAGPKRLPDDPPNILIVMLDDVGFGVSEAFGGDVKTPTFDKLSKAGIR